MRLFSRLAIHYNLSWSTVHRPCLFWRPETITAICWVGLRRLASDGSTLGPGGGTGPHIVPTPPVVDATGTHGLVCKQAPSRVVRHHALNDCISRAFGAAGIHVRKEPAGKRPDSRTLMPWRGDRPVDVTVFSTVTAASYVTAASQSTGAAAEQPADSLVLKYEVSEICWTVCSLWISASGIWDTWTHGRGYDFVYLWVGP